MPRASLFIPILAATVHLASFQVAGPISPHQSRLSSERLTDSLASVIPEIEAGRMTTPVIGDRSGDGESLVTFFARGDRGRVPRIVSDVTGWGEHVDGTFDFTAGSMTPIGRTGWYALQAKVASRARIEYLVAYGPGDYRTDPHNPREAAGSPSQAPRHSEFVMPDYVSPEELTSDVSLARGLTTETLVPSRSLGRVCRALVYTPAGYPGAGDYEVAVVLDQRGDRVSPVLDWLIAHQVIEPVVVVFVDLGTRGGDYPVDDALQRFLSDELLAWLPTRYAVTASAHRRGVIGISFGAKDALDAALSSKDAFGNLGLLIPGRRIGRTDLEAIGRAHRPGLRIAILAGQYDEANLPTARGLRQALAAAGHRVDYVEVPEGHSATTWINHLRAVLASLFGRGAPVGFRRPASSEAPARGLNATASPAARLHRPGTPFRSATFQPVF